MTLQLRRKRRTTAPRTTRLRTACKLALLAVFAAGPAAAQQPPGRPFPGQTPVYGTPFPTSFPGGVYQPAAADGTVRPGWAGKQGVPAVAPPPADVQQQPAGGPPAGYRAVGGSGPSQPPARTAPAGSAGGKVMYFLKPADTTTPDGFADAGAVALAAPADRPPVAAGVPDVPAPPVGKLPPPARVPTVAERPIPDPTPAFVPPGALPAPPAPVQLPPPASNEVRFPLPKMEKKSEPKQPEAKQPDTPIPVPKIPPRSAIFLLVDDATLQRAIINRVAEDAHLTDASNLRFPTLPPVVPDGTAYVAKTESYPPAKLVAEPAFVVHRRLHFEEKNAERYGWDLGFIQPFVSAAYFYKDVLLWPNSLASGLEVGFWDTSAGKCLPGSPTPYYLYPPGLTITGLAAEAGVLTGAGFILHPVGAGNLPGPFLH